MYLDSQGLITQKDGDGGDKLQREGFWYEGIFLNPSYRPPPGMADYSTALSVLQTADGRPLRDQVKWTDPNDVSRDQLVSNIRACGYYKKYDYLKKWECALIDRKWLYPNGDIAWFQDFARFIRGNQEGFLWHLTLFLGDIGLLINTVLRIFGGLWADNVGKDINHIGDLAQAQAIYPTPISWLSRKLYKWLRPHGVEYALKWYFRAESGANVEFIELWLPIVRKF